MSDIWIVQCYPNHGSLPIVTLKTCKRRQTAIGTLSAGTGKHIELARMYPDATFVIRRVRNGISSVRNTYRHGRFPAPYDSNGSAPRDGKNARRGKIAARSFSAHRFDGFDSYRTGKQSMEELPAAATSRKFPICETRRSY
jgi:hypothetical protein